MVGTLCSNNYVYPVGVSSIRSIRSIQWELKGVTDTLDGQARWIIRLNAIVHFKKFQIGVFHEYYSE